MRNFKGTYSFIVALLCAIFIASGAVASPDSSVVELDRQRIRAHLTKVEAELRAADVSHLTGEQRAARTANLDELRRYRLRGEFPHNTFTSGRTPVFIDDDGRACAVGHLMIESGWGDVARRIAERENLKRLPNIEEPAVVDWLEANGFTAAEATRIQPSYSGMFCGERCNCVPDGSISNRPVCGADGNSYLNECVANSCGAQTDVTPGCCSPDDIPLQPPDGAAGGADVGTADMGDAVACGGWWVEVDIETICQRDARLFDGSGTDDAGHEPSPDVGNADGSDAGDPDEVGSSESDSACSTTGLTPGTAWLILVAVVLAGVRRRRLKSSQSTTVG